MLLFVVAGPDDSTLETSAQSDHLLPSESQDAPSFCLYRALKNWKGIRMRKEKFKANFKSNRSIPNRDISRPENVSTKQNKQMAHRAPVRRAASKARGF